MWNTHTNKHRSVRIHRPHSTKEELFCWIAFSTSISRSTMSPTLATTHKHLQHDPEISSFVHIFSWGCCNVFTKSRGSTTPTTERGSVSTSRTSRNRSYVALIATMRVRNGKRRCPRLADYSSVVWRGLARPSSETLRAWLLAHLCFCRTAPAELVSFP